MQSTISDNPSRHPKVVSRRLQTISVHKVVFTTQFICHHFVVRVRHSAKLSMKQSTMRRASKVLLTALLERWASAANASSTTV